MRNYIKVFKEIGIADVPEVGGKNASLGEMINHLSEYGIAVPGGFATTSIAFWKFIDDNNLRQQLKQLMKQLDKQHYTNLRQIGAEARNLIAAATFPPEVKAAILSSYRKISKKGNAAVAVRSSATAEDLPEASFAGQHDSFLNITGAKELLNAVQQCFASLYTDRAIKYREDKGFEHEKVALSVGIQEMVRSDKAASGVAFTLEPESGSREVIHISGVWGLGENLVQGTVTPDEFLVFKPSLINGKNAIIQKTLGTKEKTMVYGEAGLRTKVININTPQALRNQYVLNDHEINQLAKWCYSIETHYNMPMDIEWAKDGVDGKIYILQARPETVQASKESNSTQEYKLTQTTNPVVTGQAIGDKVAHGIARVLTSPKERDKLKKGEIVVTDLTSPDWDPVLKIAGGIITNKGGRTSHASIVARELGVPAVVGCQNATTEIKDGEMVTISCCEGKTGKIYKGEILYTVTNIDFSMLETPRQTQAMLIVGDPENAFRLAAYPNDGVGLMRLEFIITHMVKIHPMALVNFHELKDKALKKEIETITNHQPDKKQYFIDRVAQGVGTIAAAFYPKDVIVRMSDFKTNEYANLIGGAEYEPLEENPMLGFRGASRYYHTRYQAGFALECAAIKKARDEMGLDNIKVMIPFCRTLEEASKVIDVIGQNGLKRGHNSSLEFYMMVEVPSNVVLLEKFADLFNGFSIGSNDLTQLTLGLDRDSEILSGLFNEQNEASKMMIRMAIEKAIMKGKKIGLCGQAPSDYPEFAQFLVQNGITSISFNADALINGIENIRKAEQRIYNRKQPQVKSFSINH